MKKLTITLLAVILFFGTALSQPVSNFGIIPVGVTLNSILRLNIVSGGNIEYVVNTLDQYNNGFEAEAANTKYITTFNVTSSTNFEVNLSADNANFVGTEDATHTFTIDYLGYVILMSNLGASPANMTFTPEGPADGTNEDAITVGATTIIEPTGLLSNAGDAAANHFAILWELGTGDGGINNPLLGLPSDRYVVNVILDLIAL